MTREEWDRAYGAVADLMKEHTRPFVTPLRGNNDYGVQLVGSGSYVTVRDNRILLTCEHVEKKAVTEYRGVDYSFHGTEDVFTHPGPFIKDAPLDIAFTHMSVPMWYASAHRGQPIPYGRFAAKHQLADKSEFLFIRGYADENAHYFDNQHDATATGYCSQEKVVDIPDPKMFEIFWEPGKAAFTERTSEDAKANIKVENPHGFSGSLVWNTRFVEVELIQRREWTPEDAVVTGLLHRWDPATKSLLVLPVEHLRGWLDQQLP